MFANTGRLANSKFAMMLDLTIKQRKYEEHLRKERDVEKLILTDRATRDVLEADTCRDEVVDGVILMVETTAKEQSPMDD